MNIWPTSAHLPCPCLEPIRTEAKKKERKSSTEAFIFVVDIKFFENIEGKILVKPGMIIIIIIILSSSVNIYNHVLFVSPKCVCYIS
jgi:hypothetical protein